MPPAEEPGSASTAVAGNERSTDVSARLCALIGQPQVSEAYIRFRIDLLAAQSAARSAVKDARLGSGEADRTSDALPLGRGDVVFPAGVLITLLDAIRASAVRHGQETGDLHRLVDRAQAEPERLQALAAAAAFQPDVAALESLAREWGVLVDALLFVGRSMAAPCVAESVRARAGGDGAYPVAAANRCPACASTPSVATLRRADGRRIMTCGLCGTGWDAKRLACACCGTEDQSLLGVLRLSDGDARWLETCDQCRGYIKTVDERRIPEGEAVLAVVEESATLHLDLLAEREGYIRRVPYVLSG